MLLLALAVLALERGRPTLAAGLVGVAGLAKDVNVLWAAALPEASRRDWPSWRSVMVWAVMVAGPVCAWMLYLFVAGGGLQQAVGHGNFAAPLTGFATEWGATLSAVRDDGLGEFSRARLFAMVGITVQFLVLLFSGAWRNPWGRAGIASCVLMLFLGPAVWEGVPNAAIRVLLPMTFAFNLVLPRGRWFWPLALLGNLSVLAGLETVLSS